MDDNTNQFDPRPRRSGNIRGIYSNRRLRLTSIDDIDPNVCNLMHNRKPCTPEELGELGIAPTHGDPTYETWLKDNPPTDDMTDTPPLHGDPEPAFDVDGPAILDPAPNTIYDGKGNVSVTNPDVNVDDTPPLHGDPEPPKPVDGTDVPGSPPVIEPLEPGDVGPTENSQDPGVPEGPLAPTDDVEDLPDHVVRTGSTGSGTVLLMDPLLATGAEVKVTGEVVSEGIFSVDGRVFEVNGERVLVMDYGDAAALEAEAAGISPSGSSIGSTEDGSVSMVTWVGASHFFRTESLIVLYVGESPTVIEALTNLMGPQFAGR